MKQTGKIKEVMIRIFLNALGLAIGLALKLTGKDFDYVAEQQAEAEKRLWEEINEE